MKNGISKKACTVHKCYYFEHFIIGCNSSSDTAEKAKEDSKEEQIKRALRKR